MIKTKNLAFDTQTVEADGTFGGYCNVFGIKDSYGDVVTKGAFTHSIKNWQAKNKFPPILWQHDQSQVIGVWTQLAEDERGLYGKGKLLIDDVAKAREAHALLKHGAIDGLSIGYMIKDSEFDNKNETLYLKELDLKEISVVTFPANDESRIDAVKSLLQKGELPTLSQFEKFLREAGFSKNQAVAIASHGLRRLLGEPKDTDAEKAMAILQQLT